MNDYPVENLLREATEIYTSIACAALATLAITNPHLFLLTQGMGCCAAISLGGLSVARGLQALRVKRFHHRLIAMPSYALTTTQVPISKKWLFIGKGFRWLPHHTQRLHQIKQIKNESFMQRGKCFRAVRSYCQKHENTFIAKRLSSPSRLNPFRPDLPVGGSPFLHGLGNNDAPVYIPKILQNAIFGLLLFLPKARLKTRNRVDYYSLLIGPWTKKSSRPKHSILKHLGYIPQDVRAGHTFVVGTTRVGKTRLASILINQDIRNGDAVIVVDPKGDLDLVKDMYSACDTAGRLNDFRIVHLGFPDLSAHYNPLKNFDQVSEVATRISDAIAAEGEGKQFAAFAWKYVNIVAICLEEMKQPITYKSIAFYISRLDQLLMAYADTIMPMHYPDYHDQIDAIFSHHEERSSRKQKHTAPMDRTKAVIEYLKNHISKTITAGDVESLHDQVIIDLYDAATMDKHYYDKITASVGPVLSEINKSNASSIFSFKQSNNEIELMSAIKEKKVIYIGLDSLTNPNIAQAVGKAFLSDLVSTAGKIYKESNANYRLNLHCDELSEIIQDSFVKILNKAGGAGYQVTAYAQTIQDMEVSLGSKAKAEVTEGNFNTLIMLRVKNEETAKLLVNVLPQVGVVGHSQVSMVNDTPHGEDGVYFNTTNEDRVQTTSVPMIEVSDIISLPKGQAFVLVNGGELYKVRIPLPLSDKANNMDSISIIKQVNSFQL